MEKITADWKKMMEDAGASTSYYLGVGIDTIDAKLGRGYAKAQPELLASFIQASVSEYNSNCIAKVLYDIAEEFQYK